MTPRCLLLVLALGATPALAQPDATASALDEPTAPEAAAAAGPVAAHPDPWEGFNRKVYRFNDTLDRYALKPVAKGYQRVVPGRLRSGITNFFRNLKMPVVMVNDLLQAKPRAAGHDLSRFLVNSTVGFIGFADVATVLDIPRNDEDFGQTLGVWGVRNGPYLVLPFLGPSTVRDGVGFGVDVASDPLSYVLEEEATAGLWAVKLVNTRANLLEVEQIIQGDRYLFLRDLYLQSREFAVKDGVVESDPFLDDEDYDDTGTDGAGVEDGADAEGEADPAGEEATDADAGAASAADDDAASAAAADDAAATVPATGGPDEAGEAAPAADE